MLEEKGSGGQSIGEEGRHRDERRQLMKTWEGSV